MAVTIKDLAKHERVSRQAIRARIARIPHFKDKFTITDGRKRLVKDSGINILHQHRDKPHKYFTVHDKRLLETKLKALKASNDDLRYKLRHNDKTAVVSQMRANIKDLRANSEQLRNDIKYWREFALSEQSTNRELTYYAHTNWLERLFGMKRGLKKLPKSVRTVNVNQSQNSKNKRG